MDVKNINYLDSLILFVYFQGSIKHKIGLTEYWEVPGETRWMTIESI